MKKLKKRLLIFFSIIIIIVVVVIIFISPITKYLVEKYDEKYTGRQITMNWAYVNPFTGYIHFSDLKINELKSDSVFFSTKGISVNIAMFKLLSKTYEISELTLNRPRGIIIQSDSDLNFNDLIEKFSSKDSTDKSKEPVHFNILSVKIIDGEFHYRETQIPINYFIKKVNIESTGIQWDADTTAAKFSFLPGIGTGDMKGNFTINIKDLNYRLAAVVHKFDLSIIEQYLKDLTNYGTFRANVDADIKATGNFKIAENLDAKGIMAINDFHFGKSRNEDYVSFKKFVMDINQLNPKNRKYLFDSLSLSAPYFKYERYDYSSDNVQTMFGKEGSKVTAVSGQSTKFNLIIEIARYVEILARNFFKSNYKINRLAIYQGDIRFNDFSLGEKFAMGVSPFSVLADSISKSNARVNVALVTGIKPYGDMSVRLSINPNDSSDFDLRYHFEKIPLSMFNPYLISYTSFPLDRGIVEVKGNWNVRNGEIRSNNHLVMVDPRISKRVKNKDSKWIPLKFLMFFVRETGNAIDYEIPITGNLKDPTFHWRDVIFDILKNIVVKPLRTPYRTEVKSIETQIEKSLTLKWEMRQGSFTNKQERFLDDIADFLKKNPEASISVIPMQYEEKEKELILLFEAKKKYFLSTNDQKRGSFDEEDSIFVSKISIKDTFFIKYLNTQAGTNLLFTVQDKCKKLIDSAHVNRIHDKLVRSRQMAFILFFKNKGVEAQVKIYKGKKTIPFDGYSFFKINYKDEFPESLIKASRKMDELNDEAPRKKFKKERKKITIPL